MAVVDVANKTVTLKIVYYGCAMGGKTTNLLTLHRLTDPDAKKGLVSIATNDDRTLFFDLLPIDLGQIAGLSVKAKLYTVPGQVHYELTRRQVLAGADGVVMVIDSAPENQKINQWALENVRFNLKKNGLDPDATPLVLQWNKRDLPNARPVAELEAELNTRNAPSIEAIACDGPGVIDTFAAILKASILYTYGKHGRACSSEQIGQIVDEALAEARERTPKVTPAEAKPAFEHRFDMDAYRADQAEDGHDRHVVDHESLLTESVKTNMKLAEQLDRMREIEDIGERRAMMMGALSALVPTLADPAAEALPSGVMASLLRGAKRAQGSLLSLNPKRDVLDEREVLPGGNDPLNAASPGLGSVAHRMAQPNTPSVVEDMVGELFFGDVPRGAENLASVLAAPLGCDGLKFGVMLVYARINEPSFDPTEREYWTTAATLVGLSLHWRALRRKLLGARANA